jgi:ferredoxin-type protein NapG
MPDQRSPLDRRAFFSESLRRVFGKATEVLDKKLSASPHMRPPGALPEAAFLAACTRCGECTAACPVHAIRPLGTEHGLASGTPALNVSSVACVVCVEMPCAKSCPTDALIVPETAWKGIHLATIELDENLCLAWRDMECGACARVCPVGDTALVLDERDRPSIGPDCVGCGVCLTACPTTPNSITARATGLKS